MQVFTIIFSGFSETDPQPSTLGLGFDPSAIQPESGFKPILEQGGGLPTLAFSVLDGVGQSFDEPLLGDLEVHRCLYRFHSSLRVFLTIIFKCVQLNEE